MKRLTHEEAHKRQEAMRQYCRDGHTAREVAEKFGTSRDYALQICRGIKQGNQYTDGSFDRVANAIRYINERTPNFEYAGNFTGIDGFVDLRCKTCGTVIRKSFVSVKHGHATCDECIRRERTAKEEAERIQKQKEQEEREREKWLNASCEQTAMSICPCCGKLFLPTGNMKYCSTVCSKRINNAIKKDRRIRKIRHVVVDKNITIEELYRRDKGKCWLCGRICDWSDCEDRDGVFIAFDNYPSIDHVLPLSKGGLHAWDNIRLACRGCNSKKGDSLTLPWS